MIREPFNVLVVPFMLEPDKEPLYCLLRRSHAGFWQWVAGGGETGEIPRQTAVRETTEELGGCGRLYRLSMTASIPKTAFSAQPAWPPNLYVIPEHMFAVQMESPMVKLSEEHTEARWLPNQEAWPLLHWQSNQSALWELSERLRRQDLHEAAFERGGT
jgi:dATP pyrophosphohydrolase